MKKFLAVLMTATFGLAMAGCNAKPAATTAAATTAAPAATTAAPAGDGLIKVGIINNDPNESGYRTANDKDMKATFTKENGYEAQFAYSLKNDEQIAAAKKFVTDEVDYLLLSAAVPFSRMQRQPASRLFFSTVRSMQILLFMKHPSFPT